MRTLSILEEDRTIKNKITYGIFGKRHRPFPKRKNYRGRKCKSKQSV